MSGFDENPFAEPAVFNPFGVGFARWIGAIFPYEPLTSLSHKICCRICGVNCVMFDKENSLLSPSYFMSHC